MSYEQSFLNKTANDRMNLIPRRDLCLKEGSRDHRILGSVANIFSLKINNSTFLPFFVVHTKQLFITHGETSFLPLI